MIDDFLICTHPGPKFGSQNLSHTTPKRRKNRVRAISLIDKVHNHLPSYSFKNHAFAFVHQIGDDGKKNT